MSAPTPGLPVDAIFGPELAEVLAERARAIAVFGHDATADDAAGLHAIGAKASAFMQIADDRATGPRERRNLPAAKKKAVQAAALCLALIAAINREIAREGENPC
jgi:hypothetical protein